MYVGKSKSLGCGGYKVGRGRGSDSVLGSVSRKRNTRVQVRVYHLTCQGVDDECLYVQLVL